MATPSIWPARSARRARASPNRPRTFWQSVDRLLKEAGSEKSKILQAIIWLADMADFAEMNSVWDKWVDGPNAPARATGEAKLATPEYKVEIIITAAV